MSPKYFGKNLQRRIKETLVTDVTGKCSGRFGYVIAVVHVITVSKGTLTDDGSGEAMFRVTYRAIVLRPFKDEVIEASVATCNTMGVYCEIGPLRVMITSANMDQAYTFQHQGQGGSWANGDESEAIREGTRVRLKIFGMNIEASHIFALGSLKEDFLGVVQ